MNDRATAAKAIKAIHSSTHPKKPTVPAAEDMSTEHFIRHLENRHVEDLEMEFRARPGQAERTMETRTAFEALHALRHKNGDFDHEHLNPRT